MKPLSTRSRKSISKSFKTFSSAGAIWHLFGNSLKHALDALLSEKWQNKQRREEMLKKIPDVLHPKVAALVEQVEKNREEYLAIQREGLGKAGWNTFEKQSLNNFTALDLETGKHRIPSSGLVCNLGFVGMPGQRIWQVLDEENWADFLQAEMVYRADYWTKDRHGPKERKEELWNAYFRLQPWLAEVVGRKLENEAGVKLAQTIAVDFARAYAKEAGVDVVGIAIHRENSGDLHIHLIFSFTLEMEVEEKLSKREMKALIRAMADARIAERKASNDPLAVTGRNRVRLEISKELENRNNIVMKRIRRLRSRPLQTLGPSFRGKLALWELSGRDDGIAAMGDRPTIESNTFRGLVSEPTKNGMDLTKTYIDLWGERWVCARFSGILTDTERTEARTLGEKALANYRRWGREKPSIEDYIVEQVKAMEPPDFRDELKALREKGDRLNKVEAVLAYAPATVKIGGIIATAKALVKAANHLERLKEVLQKALVEFPVILKALASAKPAADILAELAKVAREVLGMGKRQAKGKEADTPAI